MTLTTPPGTSLVASTSASVSAGSGAASGARTTTVLPPQSAGATRLTRPASAGSSGAMMPTTPVGSGMVKLKYGPETGLVLPATCASLSVQPAYQISASTADSTSREAVRPPPSTSTNCALRPSSISAARYRIWPRFMAVRAGQPGKGGGAGGMGARRGLRGPGGRVVGPWDRDGGQGSGRTESPP